MCHAHRRAGAASVHKARRRDLRSITMLRGAGLGRVTIMVGLSAQVHELISLSCRNPRCQDLLHHNQRDEAQVLPTKATKLRGNRLSNEWFRPSTVAAPWR